MGSSSIRRTLRAQRWTPKKISSTSRWIVGLTVRVSVPYAKATEGAERSSAPRERKSRRGLRRGKRRSRGGNPRSPLKSSATVVKQPTDRKVRRLLKQFAYWDVRLAEFESKFRQIVKSREGGDSPPHITKYFGEILLTKKGRNVKSSSSRYSSAAGAYHVLLRRVKRTCPSYHPMGWHTWLSSRLGWFPPGGKSASDSLFDLAIFAGTAARARRRSQENVGVNSTPPKLDGFGSKDRLGEGNQGASVPPPPSLTRAKAKGKVHVCRACGSSYTNEHACSKSLPHRKR